MLFRTGSFEVPQLMIAGPTQALVGRPHCFCPRYHAQLQKSRGSGGKRHVSVSPQLRAFAMCHCPGIKHSTAAKMRLRACGFSAVPPLRGVTTSMPRVSRGVWELVLDLQPDVLTQFCIRGQFCRLVEQGAVTLNMSTTREDGASRLVKSSSHADELCKLILVRNM